MSERITVELGDRSYDIFIGPGLLAEVGARCRDLALGERCLVVTDTNVAAAHGERCLASLRNAGFTAESAVIPAGEESKSVSCIVEVYEKSLAAGLDRRAFMVALGGGVIGDLAGFAAATFLRGIPIVQVPTSVVAMVDSAVGGKTGINLPAGKNLVGAFYQPACVIADWETLSTLPEREYVSGLAEVVKYGVIRDRAFFGTLETRAAELLARDPELLEHVIARSCEIKADVVREDEREGGLRAILNFGHTLGHALEKVAGYGRFLHGEAISVGMAYTGRVSVAEKAFPTEEQERLCAFLETLGLPTSAPDFDWASLREAMSVDKKVIEQRPRFVLARQLGEVVFGCEVAEDVLEGAWHVGGE